VHPRPISIPSAAVGLFKRHLGSSLLLGAALLLSACGADYRSTVTLTGTAATGAAIANADVQVTNADGETVIARTDSQGRFNAVVNQAAPYLLSTVDSSGRNWYSYATGQSNTANITPLTTLAVLDANGNRPLAALAADWYRTQLSDTKVAEAAARVNAHLASQMTQAGVNPNTTNIFTQPFSPNGLGLDAVLDAIRVGVNCSGSACTQSLMNPRGQTLVNWNPQIPLTGISISWGPSGVAVTAGDGTQIVAVGTPPAAGGTGTTPGTNTGTGTGTGAISVGTGTGTSTATAGTWSLIVRISAAGVGIPEITIDGLDSKPANQADFCSDSDVTEQLPDGVSIVACSWADPVGTISASITSGGFTIDYLATYTFVRR
jgi:hypothetical protein